MAGAGASSSKAIATICALDNLESDNGNEEVKL